MTDRAATTALTDARPPCDCPEGARCPFGPVAVFRRILGGLRAREQAALAARSTLFAEVMRLRKDLEQTFAFLPLTDPVFGRMAVARATGARIGSDDPVYGDLPSRTGGLRERLWELSVEELGHALRLYDALSQIAAPRAAVPPLDLSFMDTLYRDQQAAWFRSAGALGPAAVGVLGAGGPAGMLAAPARPPLDAASLRVGQSLRVRPGRAPFWLLEDVQLAVRRAVHLERCEGEGCGAAVRPGDLHGQAGRAHFCLACVERD